MAKSLKIQIEMAGAEEIKRQLEGVGNAGEAAFDKILAKAKEVGSFKELDAGFLKQTFDELGTKAPEAIGKITTVVKSASRMETLVNALTKVENGLAGIQTAASSMDAVLLKGLTRSIGMVARLLPAAFGAATIGAIASTVTEIRRLDAAAIKAGISIADMAKSEAIFKAIGLSSKSAADAVGLFVGQLEKINAANVKAAADAVDEFGRSTRIIVGGRVVDALQFLLDHMNDAGEAGEIVRKKLQEIGKLDISQPAKDIEEINNSAASAPQKLLAIIGVLEKMGPSAERTRLAQVFGPEFVQALNAGGVALELLKAKLASVPPVSQEAANAATRVALEWQKLKQVMGESFTVSPEGLNQIAGILQLIRETIVALGQLETVGGTLNIFGNTLRDAQGLINILILVGETGFKAMKYIEAGAIEVWQTIIGWINKAIDAAKQFFGMGGGQASGAGAQGMAGGGIMGGRGSGTSDSNLAWLSRGEHIMPARAVRQPGVLALLEALRRSGGNLSSVLDRMGHFALGGLVGMPAFAAGGISGMSHVTIAFPGLPPVGGLRAPATVIDELRRAAGMAQVRSGGRKPSRYS